MNRWESKDKEEELWKHVSINDTVQVYCDIEKNNSMYLMLIVYRIVDAKVWEIKEGETEQNEKMFYVHFLNWEKRMDKWIPQSYIKKNYGRVNSIIDGSNLINHSMWRDNFVLTRKRSSLFSNEAYTEKDAIDEHIKVKNVEKIILGFFEIDTWYYSPFPAEFTNNKILYICEHCLKYMRYKNTLIKHMNNCDWKTPPGNWIYNMPITNTNPSNCTSAGNRNSNSDNIMILPETKTKREAKSVSVYEIQGDTNKLYCQNLCLIAKLFLDHKSIYFDVTPFNFYVWTENDACNNNHIVAYFSKEVSSNTEYNWSCIMVLPPYQRKGYGQFLIGMSYFLSNRQRRICTPETPLSDWGKISYKSYWTIAILEAWLKNKGNLCIKDISEQTGIKTEDITYTLNELSLIKFWKGQQVVQNINTKQIEEFLNKKKLGKAHHVKFDPDYYLGN